MRGGVRCLRDLLLAMETKGRLYFWLRTLHLSFIDFLGARRREGPSIHIFTPRTPIHPSTLMTYPRSLSEREAEINPGKSPEVTTQLSLGRGVCSHCLSTGLGGADSLVVFCLSELPCASLTSPLGAVNWFTNPAIPSAHAPLSFLGDFLVYFPLPGC